MEYSSSLQSISCYAAILYKLIFQSSRSNVCWVHTYNQNGKWTHSIIAGLCATSLWPQQASKHCTWNEHWNFCGAVDPFLPTLQGQHLEQCWWSWEIRYLSKMSTLLVPHAHFTPSSKTGIAANSVVDPAIIKIQCSEFGQSCLKNTVRFEA